MYVSETHPVVVRLVEARLVELRLVEVRLVGVVLPSGWVGLSSKYDQGFARGRRFGVDGVVNLGVIPALSRGFERWSSIVVRDVVE